MNYRHAFHAGNHADVFKHAVLLALCDALTAKSAPCFAMDTHAGRGLYALDGETARRTAEADDGIARLLAKPPQDPMLARYLAAVRACHAQHGPRAFPGSPWLLAHALRAQDRIAACELQPIEAARLKSNFSADSRITVHARDGYAAIRALLPPRDGSTRIGRGLVLMDPPYEAQLAEFDAALAALREGLARWPQGMFVLWYPIKQRRALRQFYRKATGLDTKSTLLLELLVRADHSPLRMNGSGLLLLGAPWKFDLAIGPALDALRATLAEDADASTRMEWLRAPQ